MRSTENIEEILLWAESHLSEVLGESQETSKTQWRNTSSSSVYDRATRIEMYLSIIDEGWQYMTRHEINSYIDRILTLLQAEPQPLTGQQAVTTLTDSETPDVEFFSVSFINDNKEITEVTTWTVGDGGDFSKLTEALHEADKYNVVNGTDNSQNSSWLEIQVLSNHVVDYSFEIRYLDLTGVILKGEAGEMVITSNWWTFRHVKGLQIQDILRFQSGGSVFIEYSELHIDGEITYQTPWSWDFHSCTIYITNLIANATLGYNNSKVYVLNGSYDKTFTQTSGYMDYLHSSEFNMFNSTLEVHSSGADGFLMNSSTINISNSSIIETMNGGYLFARESRFRSSVINLDDISFNPDWFRSFDFPNVETRSGIVRTHDNGGHVGVRYYYAELSLVTMPLMGTIFTEQDPLYFMLSASEFNRNMFEENSDKEAVLQGKRSGLFEVSIKTGVYVLRDTGSTLDMALGLSKNKSIINSEYATANFPSHQFANQLYYGQFIQKSYIVQIDPGDGISGTIFAFENNDLGETDLRFKGAELTIKEIQTL